MNKPATNSASRVLIASLAGTTIEFFDFYIYATAAVLVFPRLFFPAADRNTASLQSLATFALAFLARPIGSAVFGHFGDRIGRKATLVAALLTMGVSTVGIGLLPTYAVIGIWAPALLALLRFGQGFGLGGEWGGAVLLATENAPAGRAAIYGMFPQLGAPIGFLCSTGAFLALSSTLNDQQLFSWGWRLPFLASALLVLVGLYVRLTLTETPAFRRAIEHHERVRVPLLQLLSRYLPAVVLGTFAASATFVIFYLMTVFTLSWGTDALGFTRAHFLVTADDWSTVLRRLDSTVRVSGATPRQRCRYWRLRPLQLPSLGSPPHRCLDRAPPPGHLPTCAWDWHSWASPTVRWGRRWPSCSPPKCAIPARR